MKTEQPEPMSNDEIIKKLKEMQDNANKLHTRPIDTQPIDTRPIDTQPHVCPDCGHCPTCGRRYVPWDTQPRYPGDTYPEPYRFGDPYYERSNPVWVYQPTITTGGTLVTSNDIQFTG